MSVARQFIFNLKVKVTLGWLAEERRAGEKVGHTLFEGLEPLQQL